MGRLGGRLPRWGTSFEKRSKTNRKKNKLKKTPSLISVEALL